MSSLAQGCVHFNGSDSACEQILRSYWIVYRYFVKVIQRKEAREIKARTCLCLVCKASSSHLLACLSCVCVGCLRPENHMYMHYQNTNHGFAIELGYGHVYCMKCLDFIYHAEIDRIAMEIDQQLKEAGHSRNGQSRYRIWEPSMTEMELLRENPKRRKLESNSTTGLQGLFNLGNTCFMNCILQALTHTPVLRDYILSDQHKCDSEQQRSMCVVCYMSSLFQQFYSGQSSPHDPFKLLFLIWTHARNLAGYEQQDAHEFFISILDVLHRQAGGQTPLVVSQTQCHCFVDRIFGGKLQSDVSCELCDGVSTTIDPVRDISLDLAPHLTSPQRKYHGKMMPYQQKGPSTLTECLDRFTRHECLGSEAKIYCSQCRSKQVSTKKLIFHQLPVVLVFHLKRFEHTQESRKISRFISFPLELDMSPYIAEGSEEEHSNQYLLYAVVNHHGSLNNGHYTCYIRQQEGQWFNCDDDRITKATTDAVLRSEGYLLFYHKKVLDMSY